MVDQSVYKLADEDDDAEQDERRNLFYRDSRSAIERARQRHMSRKAPQAEPADDDAVIKEADIEASPAAREKPTFEPDDFVEEETPQVTPVDEQDDALISEGIRTPSPRARRLRRFRDNPHAPKEMTAAKSEPEPDRVDQELPPSAAPERGRFDSVPEISAEFELPLLRRPSSAPEPEPTPTADAAPAASSYERALKRAHDLNQASRLENNQQRRQPMPAAADSEPRTMPDIPVMQAPPVETRPIVHADTAQASTSAVLHPRANVERVEEPDGRTRIQPRRDTIERPRTSEPLVPSPDARQSWWRGAKHVAEAEALKGAESAILPSTEARMTDVAPVSETLDLHREEDLQAFRSRLFANDGHEMPAATANAAPGPRNPISLARRERQQQPAPEHRTREKSGTEEREVRREAQPVKPADEIVERPAAQRVRLAEPPQDEWYAPEELPQFDMQDLMEADDEWLDMKIEIAPKVTKACMTCRNYRPSEQPGRGWCTNNWAFTHRQMVNEGDIACKSTIGCWWLPADEEVWLDDFDVAEDATPRIDRLLARLHPDRRAVGNE